MTRQVLGRDGQEDEIVDAENDLEKGQGDQADPAVDGEHPVIPDGPINSFQPIEHHLPLEFAAATAACARGPLIGQLGDGVHQIKAKRLTHRKKVVEAETPEFSANLRAPHEGPGRGQTRWGTRLRS
jgi:hypothetical protein